jgi:zinc and cadmium transporter
MDLIYLIIASLACGLLSLSAALVLVLKSSWAHILVKYGTPFAAGVLLIAAFRDLMPHGINEQGAVVLNATLAAIVIFFFIEKGFNSFHHHHEEDMVEGKNTTQGWMFVISDVFHNFIDGIALGSAFLISPSTGLVATIALISHDIPLEVGEFGVQIRSGFSTRQTILRNIISSLTLLVGSLLVFLVGDSIGIPYGYLYGGIAGFFIYIALSDIIPTIHSSETTRFGLRTVFFVVGIIFGTTVTSIAHDYIETPENNEHSHNN